MAAGEPGRQADWRETPPGAGVPPPTNRPAATAAPSEVPAAVGRALEDLPLGLFLTDTRGRIVYANPAFCTLSGYAREELIGRTPRVLKSDRTPPAAFEQLWETIATGRPWRGELCNRRPDGSLYWQATTITPVRNEHGRITHYLAIAEDVSERRQWEEALIQAAEGVSAQAGARFLHTAVWYLADTLGMERVLVAALEGGGEDAVLRIIAEAARTEVPLRPTLPPDSPLFARLFEEGELLHPERAAEAYAEDPVVRRLNPQALLAAVIEDEHGQRIGVLLATGGEPLADGHHAQILTRLTARRIATEMARLRSEEKLRRQLGFLRDILDRLPDPVVVTDPRGRLRWANRKAHVLGVDETDPETHTVRAPLPLGEVRRSGRPVEVTREFRPRGRGARILHITAVPLWNEDGSFRGAVGLVHDVTERKAGEERLRGEWQRLVSVLEVLPAYVCLLEPDGTVRYANRHFRERFGDATGRKSREVFPWREPVGPHCCQTMRVFDTDQPETWETQDPYGRFFEIHSYPFVDPDGQRLALEVGIDITARKTVERRLLERREDLERVAYHDPLTGLPNRLLCQDRLYQTLQRARRTGETVAVLFLDLDGFKEINDAYGHDVGDEVLKLVARRLKGCLRKGDTIARLGGDEFLMILERLHRLDDVASLAQKIIGAVSRPAHVRGHELRITPSIGIALYPTDHQDPDTLIKYADMAMYRAKREGPGRYQFYTPDLTAEVVDRMQLREELHRAIERNELVLLYQPQVDLTTRRIVAVEALVRWQHSTRGLLPPRAFVPVAEQAGLMPAVGRWVLERACMQAAAWEREGIGELRVAVNLSHRQFRERDLVHWLGQTLRRTGADPARLELEIRESSLMEDTAYAERRLHEIRALGVATVLDDYGTGASALEVLARMPLAKLKISERLVAHVPDDAPAAAACGAIVALGAHLRKTVVAEGIERPEQLAFFRRHPGVLGQGHLFSRPGAADAIVRLLRLGTLRSGF